jgi:hypothetical protein
MMSANGTGFADGAPSFEIVIGINGSFACGRSGVQARLPDAALIQRSNMNAVVRFAQEFPVRPLHGYIQKQKVAKDQDPADGKKNLPAVTSAEWCFENV